MLNLKRSLVLAGAVGAAGLLLSPFVAIGDDAVGATITGKVSFAGEKPKKARIDMSGVPECHDLHGDEKVYDEKVVINENGTLANVFVYVSKGLEGKTFEAPKEPVVLNQQGCTYKPHVFGIMVGQPLEVRNSDPLMHNIHAIPTKNQEFNVGQIKGAKPKIQTFAETEVMVMFKCEVHGWMTAYAGVMSNPFYAVSNDQGAFEIKGLPAGTYEITAWHELYGSKTASVTVGDKESKAADFSFEAK
ncbi:MAG: hypothetical protein HZA54_12785 [Planctomycetes bacterium]|nr:hypothetical protein [Planctomycetota bacterium]